VSKLSRADSDQPNKHSHPARIFIWQDFLRPVTIPGKPLRDFSFFKWNWMKGLGNGVMNAFRTHSENRYEKGFSNDMQLAGPFDFSAAMRLFCEDITRRLEAFSHIRMEEVAVTFSQTRSRASYGLQAKLTPMRFEAGALEAYRHGRNWRVQRLFDQDLEMLYILTFYLPRFQNQTFREKMITVFHELYHISPHFEGDIRRMEGRYHVHSHSQKEYDRLMEVFVDQYLKLSPPKELYQFLRVRFKTLHARHGGVIGLQIPIPKLIPVEDSKSA